MNPETFMIKTVRWTVVGFRVETYQLPRLEH
jgi:hypothetical protein